MLSDIGSSALVIVIMLLAKSCLYIAVQ